MAAPPKIICIGLNYHDHALEQGAELPKEPLLFGKFASALIGPDEAIVLPPESAHVDAEAELAVVIGAAGRRVSEADALDLVAGYTVANDVTARDLQKSDGQWLRAKGFDTFCPLLPGVVPVSELGDGSGLRIVQRLNGEALQDSATSELIFGVPRLVAHARRSSRCSRATSSSREPRPGWACTGVRPSRSQTATWWRSRSKGSGLCGIPFAARPQPGNSAELRRCRSSAEMARFTRRPRREVRRAGPADACR